MRYLGKGSVSSFLGVCLNIAWYVCIIAMAAILIAALVIGILIPHALNNSHFSLQIDGPILSFNLPSTVIKNPQALVFSGMALGFVMLGFALGAALNPDLTGIFAGLVFLVLGEVFRIGAKMQEEQDLTV